jgi:Skp family chaperone for outer membrane proteins
MRTFRLIAISAVFAAVFAVSAFAQTAAGKIGLINTQAFDDDKVGITKYVSALNSLETEFKPLGAELQAATIQKGGKIPISDADLQKKADDYDKMSRELKFKQEDAKVRYENRERIVMGPIRQDIGNAIQEYTKKNGYMMILDLAKLDSAGLMLGVDDTADITKQFITFYNARPATTATVTK